MKLKSVLIRKIVSLIQGRKQGLGFLFFNVSGNLFTFLISFVLPFLLSVEGYGYFALVFALHNVIIAFFTFGLDSSIIKFSIEKKSSSNVLFTSFIAWLIMALFLILVFLILAWFVVKLKFLNIELKPLIYIIISAMMISFQRIVLAYHIANSEVKKYGRLFIFNKLVQLILVFVVVLIYTEKIFLNLLPYILLVQGLVNLLYVFFITFVKQTNFKTVTFKSDVVELIKFTLPLSINTVGNLGYSYGFNVFVSPFLTFAQLGILNIFTQLGSIGMMTINALNSGYIPTFYEQYYLNYKKAVINYFHYIAQNALIIVISIFIVGSIYKYYAYAENNNYLLSYLSIYLLGVLLYSFKSIGSNYLIIRNKTILISSITVFTSIFNIFSGIILTKIFGFAGCVISLSVGYFIQVLAFNYDAITNLKKNKI
ncbi:hypothetical protein EC396_15135 [Lutibacter sp. HS1-25]|uniref:oligosaccharide flippase family protein n=1 Tax=Lutibacter sp. HS1-25 TaxID=2485000 RepID=UPI0010139863|nr:oligosaccharide flippase family protein [Lutibacter sp. HS1-25]RXP45918.1 hypothetical protein EC396_15135 [Lutibacter sp. HS1-25]